MIVTTSPAVAPRSRRTALPREFVGSHTTASGMSVTVSGNVMLPAGPATVTGDPPVAPSPAAVAADSRTVAAFAVPAR